MTMGRAVKFGTAWVAHDYAKHIRLARASEDAGFDLLASGDSQSLFLDPYTVLTLFAEHTDHVQIGTTTTNPVTRHPAVAAGAIASIQQLSNGRAFFGLGSGDSSVANIGMSPASYRTVGEYGSAVRKLTAGEEVQWEGAAFRMHWDTQRVPLYLFPEGPKGLRQAGRIADGVFLNVGITPEVLSEARRLLNEGAQEVGRSIDDIDIWVAVRGFMLGPTEAEALESVKYQLAGTVNHVFRFTLDGKLVPDEHREGILNLQREYRASAHFSADAANPNAALLDKYGLLKWAAERFAIAGPPEYCVERLQGLVDLGVDKIFISHKGRDVEEFGRVLREKVVSAFR